MSMTNNFILVMWSTAWWKPCYACWALSTWGGF